MNSTAVCGAAHPTHPLLHGQRSLWFNFCPGCIDDAPLLADLAYRSNYQRGAMPPTLLEPTYSQEPLFFVVMPPFQDDVEV